MQGLDGATYYTFQYLRPKLPLLTDFLRGASLVGSYVTVGLVVLAAVVILLLLRRYRAALFLAGLVLAGVILAESFKLAVGRERPADWDKGDGWEGMPNGFPSGHALLVVVTYGGVVLLLARAQSRLRRRIVLWAAVVFLALLTGFGQLFLGYNNLSDVLAGWAGGLGLLLAACNLIPDERPAPATALNT
jgi:undecaprenyl-diphosphatase